MVNIAHDLFLLSANLTQFKSKVLIIKVFIESINTIFTDLEFKWIELEKTPNDPHIEVCTRTETYGYIQYAKTKFFTDEEFSLFQNAVQLLAIQLEKLEQESFLKNQKEHLDYLVKEQTKELQKSKKELEDTKDKIERQNRELKERNIKYESLNEELQRANKELRIAKGKAEGANRIKTEFINNMSHEIRTPMNGIIGFSDLLNTPGISEEKRKIFSKIVQNSSNQLLRIIDDILDISKLETKQVKLNEAKFCLNDLIMELFSIFSLKSKQLGIPFYVKKALHDNQSYIISDKSKLNKILGNLLENALKFTSEGFVEMGYFLEKTDLVLYVKDTGIGISPENHQTIFERFTQEEKELSRKQGGLGLGLSISKENTSLLGGEITLKSQKGRGSTFLVSIPYKAVSMNKEVVDKTLSDESVTDKQSIILLVEDEEFNYIYFEALFEEEKGGDYILLHAKNGKEAVNMCMENRNIDLVIMDIKMPVMNGLEATEKIKSMLPDLPVIAQTAYSTEKDKQTALNHGCNDYISKPVEKEEFFRLINKYLRVK